MNNTPWIRKIREITEKVIYTGSWAGRLGILTGYQGVIQTKKYRLHLTPFPTGIRPLHIVFASDFHMGPTTHPHHILNALRQVDKMKPDILLLGGDFVYLDALYIKNFIVQMQQVVSPEIPKFAVLGNHDNHLNPQYIAEILQNAGIRMLVNRCVKLPAPYEFISLHGLDDWISGTPDVGSAFAETAEIKLVLMHSPSNYLDLQNQEFDVAFCGHTHGGQIAFADGSPLRAGSGPLCRRFNSGMFRLGETLQKVLIVSKGVGFGSLPFRVNAAPEIISCKIMPND